MQRRLIVFFALAAMTGCATRSPTAIERLKACAREEGPSDAYCGRLEVFEDRARGTGRKIALKIVVLPALRRDSKPDPIFIFAGGPGQGAATLAPTIRVLFQRLQTDRDIVMIDQRGTGDSHPLDCHAPKRDSDDLTKLGDDSVDRYRDCLSHYDAAPALYTTSIAVDDIDDVRAFLGYRDINLWGASYGTRAALVYLRQHSAHVRSVVLDGVVPTDMKMPLSFARDGQRALDAMVESCSKEAACHAAYPELKANLDAVLQRLDASPKVKIIHPRTGERAEVPFPRRVAAGILMSALYSPVTASLLPRVIDDAFRGDYDGLLALGMSHEGAAGNISEGMYLSVVCSEDVPAIRAELIAPNSEHTFLRDDYLKSATKPCAFWPTQKVDAAFYAPVVSDKPVLLLSGEIDPVTPPAWAEGVAKHLTNAKHLVVPATGHGTTSIGCVPGLIEQFFKDASSSQLYPDCVKRQTRPPFFSSLAGATGREGRAERTGHEESPKP